MLWEELTKAVHARNPRNIELNQTAIVSQQVNVFYCGASVKRCYWKYMEDVGEKRLVLKRACQFMSLSSAFQQTLYQCQAATLPEIQA